MLQKNVMANNQSIQTLANKLIENANEKVDTALHELGIIALKESIYLTVYMLLEIR